eukprot:jgi/Mesvir1/11801/Mv25965-RA.1
MGACLGRPSPAQEQQACDKGKVRDNQSGRIKERLQTGFYNHIKQPINSTKPVIQTLTCPAQAHFSSLIT